MREIKFRVIDKNTKKRWSEEDLIFHDGIWYEDWRAFEDGIPLNMENCVVMQYTGLKDKNGTEIYEGDILTDHGEEYLLYESHLYVEYSKERGSFDFVDKFDYFGITRYTAFEISYEHFEVIGNIYENPELLERAVEE